MQGNRASANARRKLSFLDNKAINWFFGCTRMAKRKLAIESVRRLEARTKVIQGAGLAVFVMACLAVGFVVVAAAVPQKRKLEQLQAKLERTQAREQEVLSEREDYQIEFQALREDPSYLEIHARDRLNYYREGERVLKFRKPE
jgi:cell division protein FtsB